MVPFLRRPALVAGLTALMLSMPAAALAQPATSSPTPTRTALTRVWQQIHQVRGTPEPAWLAGRTAGTSAVTMAPQLSASYQGALEGVSSVPSTTHAWAVGAECASGCGTSAEVDDTLILHWDGSTWTQVPGKNPSGSLNVLLSVTSASSATCGRPGSSAPAAAPGFLP